MIICCKSIKRVEMDKAVRQAFLLGITANFVPEQTCRDKAGCIIRIIISVDLNDHPL